MPALAFDIETAPLDPHGFTPAQTKRLAKETARLRQREPHLSEDEAAAKACCLTPHLGYICAVSIVWHAAKPGPESYHSWAQVCVCPEAERWLLAEFFDQVEALAIDKAVSFNGKRFDAPFIAARALTRGLAPPRRANKLLDTHRWRSDPHADLMHLFAFATSLDDLCSLCGVDSPKTEMTGAQVYQVLAEKGGAERVRAYVTEDSRATLECYDVARHHGLRV